MGQGPSLSRSRETGFFAPGHNSWNDAPDDDAKRNGQADRNCPASLIKAAGTLNRGRIQRPRPPVPIALEDAHSY